MLTTPTISISSNIAHQRFILPAVANKAPFAIGPRSGVCALDLYCPRLRLVVVVGSGEGPPIIYVGTGEANDSLDSYYGIGILKSSDGGNTWSLSTGAGAQVQLPSPVLNPDGPFVGAAISKIVLDPGNPQHILAAVYSSGLGATKSPATAIFESLNGGDSWNPTSLENRVTSYNCSDLIYDPVEKAVYAAIQELGVFRLGPGDTTW